MTAWPVLLISLLLAFVSAVGRAQKASSSPSGSVATTTSGPQDIARARFAAWMTALPSDEDDRAHALRYLSRAVTALKANPPKLAEATADEQTAHRWASQYAAAVARDPVAGPDVRPLATLRRQQAADLLAATAAYVKGLERRDEKTLNGGDRLLSRADAMTTRELRQADAVYQRLGGAKGFAGRIDFNALVAQTEQNRKDAGP